MVIANNNKKGKKRSHNTQTKRWCTIQLLTTPWTMPGFVPLLRSAPLMSKSPSSYTGHDVLCCGISLRAVWVACPACVPSVSLVYLLTSRAWDTHTKSPWLRINAVKQNPKHQHVINTVLIQNPKHSPLGATEKKFTLSQLYPAHTPY